MFSPSTKTITLCHSQYLVDSSARSRPSSSVTSSSSLSSNTPLARRFRMLYARDSKGHDMTPSYPYKTPTSSCSSSIIGDIPPSYQDSLTRLRYARDGKGHDFTQSYVKTAGAALTEDDETRLLTQTKRTQIPESWWGYKGESGQVNRYAKDGKGIDFSKSYRH